MLCCLPRWTLPWSCVAKSRNNISSVPMAAVRQSRLMGRLCLRMVHGTVVALDVTVIGNRSRFRAQGCGVGLAGSAGEGPAGALKGWICRRRSLRRNLAFCVRFIAVGLVAIDFTHSHKYSGGSRDELAR